MPSSDFTGVVDGGGSKESQQTLKVQYQLVDPVFVHEVAQVLTHGMVKYAKNNWMRGISWTDVFRAILHHLYDWFRGEEIDPDSGLPHLAHAACELMFLRYYSRNYFTYQIGDDRVYLDLKAEELLPMQEPVWAGKIIHQSGQLGGTADGAGGK